MEERDPVVCAGIKAEASMLFSFNWIPQGLHLISRSTYQVPAVVVPRQRLVVAVDLVGPVLEEEPVGTAAARPAIGPQNKRIGVLAAPRLKVEEEHAGREGGRGGGGEWEEERGRRKWGWMETRFSACVQCLDSGR